MNVSRRRRKPFRDQGEEINFTKSSLNGILDKLRGYFDDKFSEIQHRFTKENKKRSEDLEEPST